MSTVSKEFVGKVVRHALAQCFPDCQPGACASTMPARVVFDSTEAVAIKQEIIDVGRKLWLREYVDGNGGNISYRITKDHVLCTPTMLSKADLTLDDICLVNLENEMIIGKRSHTSEMLLHLEIYKAVPRAKAVIHCHPPHATAYAITGSVPPVGVIPEQEVFVGLVATTPYETPGTKTFAETVLPYIKKHNTILLENHGVVCWADTVTHAEWCVEVLETYCRTLILASQLGKPIRHIPAEKIAGLLEIKSRLGLPDARLDEPEDTKIADPLGRNLRDSSKIGQDKSFDDPIELLVTRITEEVFRFALSTNE
jgi:L-fuculose-phosphate aldolase